LRIRVLLNSDNIRILMAKKNMTSRKVSYKLGTTEFYVSQMLSGRRSPSPQMREKIMNVFGRRNWDMIFKIDTNTTGAVKVEEFYDTSTTGAVEIEKFQR